MLRAEPAPPTDDRQSRGGQRLRRIMGYGTARGLVELLLGVRGIALAAMLGPSVFGIWSLMRVLQQYLTIAGLGIERGLEVEASAHRDRIDGRLNPTAERFARAGSAFLLLSLGALSLLAAGAALATSDPVWRMVLAGIAVASLGERLWFLAATFLRAQASVRVFASIEVAQAGLQLVAVLALTLVWGLPGAIVGMACANLGGLLLTWGRMPLRPVWSWPAAATMIGLGLPVAVGVLMQALLASIDRFIVAAMGGVEMLGQYAFGVSVATLGAAAGVIVRTAVFPEIFHAARHGGQGAWVREMDRLLLTLSWTLSLLLGLISLGIGPVLARFLPDYAGAAGVARIFMFTGVAQGLMAVAMLGSQAARRQRFVPWVTAAAVVASAALASASLALGLGLEGLAVASLATRLGYAVALAALGRPSAPWPRELRFAAGLALPVIATCIGVQLLVG